MTDDEALQQRLERILLGGSRQYTRTEVAEITGVPPERSRALWRALGFATQDDDAAVFTDGDVRALRITSELIRGGIVDPSIATATARMIGQHMSRLAESQVHMLRDVLAANPEIGADDRQLARLVEHLTPELEALQDYVWRRHLAANSVRMLGSPGENLDEHRQVVGFADMVGFTTLTRRSNEAELVAVVDRFEALAADIVAENHGRIVKMLGDEVLFVADSPADGAEIALSLLDRADKEDGVPSLRAGLAYGRVLSRFGDVYGSVVNIASRLTSVARPSTVLVDLELAEALNENPEYALRSRRPVSVRGYTRLRSSALRRAGEDGTSLAESAQRIAAEVLGLLDDDEEPPHLPLAPDDEAATPRRKGRRRRR
ncbi:adenylate/guanylate cyclase domain-containing protein [Actinophytocola algeriensis]|uniref:Adenylate cyclase n=1 Tax=Actinophytocola algeriensis TaxID=1768010 RepID=A0A7W7Q737_9PSEU|nr:adenylate/guanylate cyclase domain-containing protein [Actinophytocola algeriensis]MBB4908063.1 adenylate cyclase [Actinophytocola algeriensis]MBE1480093.1 adenylate cyclase [Actinophytocola algeriensis]